MLVQMPGGELLNGIQGISRSPGAGRRVGRTFAKGGAERAKPQGFRVGRNP